MMDLNKYHVTALIICLYFLSCTSVSPTSPPPANCQPNELNLEGLEILLEPAICSASLRGLHVINDKTGWASGSSGTILRMTDGVSWKAIYPQGYNHLDFRDIHGFDASTAIAMAAGEEGRIIRTEDGGGSWVEVYTNLEDGIFLDGMDFDGPIGYCIGDPLDGSPFILRTDDAGMTWQRLQGKTAGAAIPGEGSYAASGTTIVHLDQTTYCAYGGDSLTRVLRKTGTGSFQSLTVQPMRMGAGCGIFSMAFKDKLNGVAVGGCYLDSLSQAGNHVFTRDGGTTWNTSLDHPPGGYRSCVAYASSGGFYITCGRTGIDFSYDEGFNWLPLSTEGYFACDLATSSGWLVGRNGKMAKIAW